MNKTTRRVRSRNSAILCLIGVFIFGLGYLFGHGNLQLDKNYVPHLVKRELGKPKDVDFSLFWDVYNRVQDESLHSATAQTTLYGAIAGAVGSLDDPYSAYLTPEETKLFLADLSGQVEGIGAEIGKRNGVPVVIAPIEGSPAGKAGLKKGDNIVAIDGQSTEKMSLDAAVLKIRGAPGSQVKLTIVREGEDKARDITITRAAVAVKDAEWQVTKGVMVVRVRQFGDSVDNDLEQVAVEMKSKKITELIIDLRDNPGGLLDKAVAVLGDFLSAGTVAVKQAAKDGSIEELKTNGNPVIPDARVIILVNGGSASASEIFAGAFQDHKRGQVIGEKTFGKGTVQALEELKGGSSLKLTVAKWLTPSGREIDKGGIEPDIAVPMSQEDFDAGRDPQLDRAFVEINR